jgi:protocatechuate 3,4-dioxygenase beta subunit
VVQGEGGELVARSGADGSYSIRGLSARAYRLLAEDGRFVPWSRRVTVPAGQSETVDVPLVRGATLQGRVTDEDGRPVEGAVVRVSPGGENVLRRFERAMMGEDSVRTGRDGSFRATRLRPGDNQRLDVTHDDFEERAAGGLSLAPGATRSGVAVVLRRGRSLRGLVKDEEGRPLAGAEVTLSRPLTMRAGRGGMQMSFVGPGLNLRRETGADGRFEFRGLKAGDYALSARRAGFSRARLDPVKLGEGGEEPPVELVLKPGATITGMVRDKTGAGASGWQVAARPAGEAAGPAFGGIGTEEPTGPDGAFVLEGLTAGEAYDLQAMGTAGLGPRRQGVIAPSDSVELVVTGAGQVRGRVVDAESGRPVPDFQLRYQPDSQGGVRFVMRMGPGGRGRGPYERIPFQAEDGTFVLEDVPAGRWTLEAFAPGFQPGTAAGVAVGEGELVEGIEVRLSRGAVLSGRVLDARTGRPILDASVRAEQSGGEARRGMIRMGGEPGDNEAMTDGDGRYEIAGLAPGTWTVTASHAEWSEKSESVEIKAAASTADIRLGRGGSIGGVVSAGGSPVAGAQVQVSVAGDTGFRASPGFMGGGEQSALSDESGRFRFERLTPGRYTLVASLRDQSSAPVEATLTADEAQEVQLALAAGTLVRGVVRGLPEPQLVGLTVSAHGGDFFATTRTGAGGAFELAGVPEGSVTLSARSGDFVGGGTRSSSTTLQIAPGQAEAAAEIVFEPGFRVDGRVTRGGKPVTEAWVSAFSESAGKRNASDMTDESGAFVLEGLDEARYTIVASGQSGASIRKTVELAGDLTVDLEAPPARLAGTVVEAESGRPLGDVEVRLEEEPGAMRFVNVAATDSAGRFAFEDLEPKRYRVSFQKAAYQVETRELAAAEDGAEQRVELRRGEGIGIEVRDGILAIPLRGLFVRAVDASGQTAFAGAVSLDSDGRGEVPSLRPGTYEVRAESSGYAPVSLPGVAVPSRTLSLVLTPGGSLDIRVGPETLALPAPSARLFTADGRAYAWNAFTTDGKIQLGTPSRRLGNVAPGRYVLQVEGGARRELTIAEGGASVVTLP